MNELLRQNSLVCNKSWANSIAVGSKDFIENFKNKLGLSASKRIVAKNSNAFILAEDSSPYSYDFAPKIEALRGNNSVFWQ